MKKIELNGIIFSHDYYAEEDGRIWSSYKKDYLSPSKTKKGYYRIVLQTTNGRKTFQLHRLILYAFNPIDDFYKMEVNHKDGNKGNNNINNLEWCNGSFNVRHSIDTGLKIPARGTSVYGNKISEKDVIEICELLKNTNLSLREIGDKFGVSKYCIYDIKRKKSWSWLTEKYYF